MTSVSSWQNSVSLFSASFCSSRPKYSGDSAAKIHLQFRKFVKCGFFSLGLEDPLEEEIVTHSSIPLGKYHEQKSLVCCSLSGCKEWDTTDHAHTSESKPAASVAIQSIQCVVCILHISWTLTLYHIDGLQICSPLCRLSFPFIDDSFGCAEPF